MSSSGTSVRVSIVGSGSMNKDVPIPHHAQLAHADGRWAPVVIKSDPIGAFAAARLLARDIGGLDHMDEHVVVDVPIARNKHASIVGRKGLTLMGLSADHGVRIMVPHKRGGGSPLAVAHKQGGDGGGGDERLFPGTDDFKSGKGSNKKGKGRRSASDDENHAAESYTQLPGHLQNPSGQPRRRPARGTAR